MTLMKIEVVPDTSTPMGGHAIIRVSGVAPLPADSTFRIDPIDDSLDHATQPGWPLGALTPLETRQTADGFEMWIGPEIVDAPRLEPGTPVTISIPNSHISAELVWPNLPMSTYALGAPVVMTPSQMANELAAAESTREGEILSAELERNSHAISAGPSSVTAPSEAAKSSLDGTSGQRDAARVVNGEESLSATKVAHEPPPFDGHSTFPTAQMAPPDRSRLASAEKSLSRLANATKDRPATLPLGDSDTSLPAIVLKRSSDGSAPQAGVSRGELRQETIDGHVSKIARPPSRLMPFLAGACVAGLAAAAVVTFVTTRSEFNPLADPTISAAAQAARGNAKIGISDAFTSSTLSPRGEIATDVDLPTALRLADYNLHGIDRPVDRAEAEFWLKKAMSLTAGHSQLRWALTQLGTLQAEPVTGPPSYDKARILWEVAAANGDPVAMCFLGTLLEYGLGVGADKARALDYYKRSKDFGGCPNADASIARLSK